MKGDIYEIIEENDVKFIKLQFTDVYGNLKNISILASELKKALYKGIMFDGSLIKGFAKDYEPYMFLKPDFSTFAILPWRPNTERVGRLICDIYTEDGKPFKGDPRYKLKKVIEEGKSMGYTFNIEAKCKFFLFKSDEHENPIKSNYDRATYCDVEPLDVYADVRREICLSLEEMGYEVETSHHERLSCQHEIGLSYNEALKMADNIMTFKLVSEVIANINNLYGEFKPQLLKNKCDSGVNINISLCEDGKEIFFNSKDNCNNKLSNTSYSFMAGVMNHGDTISKINNFFHNPYLVFAACLRYGLNGIKNKLK